MNSPEFQEWCHIAVSENTDNPMLWALLDGDFPRAYPLFMEYWKQRKKRILDKWSKNIIQEEEK